jgi:NADH-quinone oxidoreductase subunit N
MSPIEPIRLLPLLVLFGAAMVLLLALAFWRRPAVVQTITLAGLVLSFAALFPAAGQPDGQVTLLLRMDRFALFFVGLLLAAALAVTLLSERYLKMRRLQPGEFNLLLLLATLAGAVLAAADHLASFLLALETLSVSLYALIAYPRTRQDGLEAGIKYLVLAAVSSAFLLFGMALLYAETGTMSFSRLAVAWQAGMPVGRTVLLPAGLGLLIVGIGFKLAVVPFHLWTPDVYEGAPAPVSAFVATVSKGSMVALLVRFFIFLPAGAHLYDSVWIIFSLIAIASMIFGNILALLQNNLKRILAYSSIAHIGYLLVAFLAGGDQALTAIAFYLTAYFITTIGAFGVMMVCSGPQRDADAIEDYRGLFSNHPWLAGILTAMLLSLAGIPLTAGFVGKFYLVLAGVSADLWAAVVVLVVTSTIGLFYYLRVIAVMYAPAPTPLPPEPGALRPFASAADRVTLGLLTLSLVWLGIGPGSIIDLIRSVVFLP